MGLIQRLAAPAVAVVLAGLVQSGMAASVNLATGLNASNTVIATGGVTDAHWTATTDSTFDPTGTAQTVYPNNADWFGGWLANGPNSTWIARNANVTDNGPAPYTFTRTFDFTNVDLSTASISGSWAIDDQGTLSLNGHLVSSLGSGAWGGLTSFSDSTASDFVQGINTLTITITSDDRFLEAVRLEGTATGRDVAVVPLPASFWSGLGMLGAIACGMYFRRRLHAAV